MKKKWLASVLALLLAVTPITAYAEDFSGGDGWKVSFDGKKMTSTFKNTDIDDKIYEMEPGDTVDFHIQLKNEYTQTTDWYMTNEVLKSLEDAQTVAEGGAYSYILTYIKQDGTKETLYSSEEVGGETKNASGEGLHQATNSLKDYFYLDRLKSGQSGEITLKVKLEGETQGNTYQDTLAKLQMNFAVELVDDSTTPGTPGTPGNPGSDNPTKTASRKTFSRTTVKTGDNSRVLLYSIIALIAGLVCAGAVVYNVRQNREDAEETVKKNTRQRRSR